MAFVTAEKIAHCSGLQREKRNSDEHLACLKVAFSMVFVKVVDLVHSECQMAVGWDRLMGEMMVGC